MVPTFHRRKCYKPSPIVERYSSHGTPLILAPSDILLNASVAWSGYLLCRFFGNNPSPAKIFSDLNPIWGRHGQISVKSFSEDTCLIHIPSPRTRQWVLDSCLWSAGTVSFAVSEWSASPTLINQSLTTASTWLTIREMPPQLWSEDGARLIAGRLGTVVTSSRVILPPDSLGTAKVRIIIRLADPRPSSVVVQDAEGNQVRVTVDFGRLPPLCPSCRSYGHLAHRCPSRRRSPPSKEDDLLPAASVQVEDFISKNPNPPNSSLGPSNQSQPISSPKTAISVGPASQPGQTSDGPLKPILNQPSLDPEAQLHLSSSISSDPFQPSKAPSSNPPSRRRSRPRGRTMSPPHPSSFESASYRSLSPSSEHTRKSRQRPNQHIFFNTPSSSADPPSGPFSPPSVKPQHQAVSPEPPSFPDSNQKTSFRNFYHEVINSIKDQQLLKINPPIVKSKKAKGEKSKRQTQSSVSNLIINEDAILSMIGKLDPT